MKNPMGLEMSPRAERIYSWLNKRGIPLTQWSTDQCVQQWWGKLQDAAQLLQSDKPDEFLDNLPVDQVQAMERDLQAIMRRLPSQRIA